MEKLSVMYEVDGTCCNEFVWNNRQHRVIYRFEPNFLNKKKMNIYVTSMVYEYDNITTT